MLCFYKKASNSDCVIQLGRTGRGKWHQMAKGGSASPFTKEGSNYPSAPCPSALKLTLSAGSEEVPAAASKKAFPVPRPT